MIGSQVFDLAFPTRAGVVRERGRRDHHGTQKIPLVTQPSGPESARRKISSVGRETMTVSHIVDRRGSRRRSAS